MAHRVKLERGIVRVGLPLEQVVPVVPCGLIADELVSNALKHGFAGKDSGRISVELETIGEQTLALNVRDDGVGLPSGFDPSRSSTLGIQLVSRLAGLFFSVVFPVAQGSLIEEVS